MFEELKKEMAAGQALAPFKDQLLLDITSEGLRIQIVDKENRPMFASGSAQLKDYTETILNEVARVINKSPNRISLSGHTDRTPFAGDNGYSNWELSADRANAARRALTDAGLAENKIGRVVGLSDSVLFDKKNPYNPINRRISIVVMNKATEKAMSEGEGKAAKPVAPAKKPATKGKPPASKPMSSTEKKAKPPAKKKPAPADDEELDTADEEFIDETEGDEEA
jgi:chemotaxis protein MotB